VKIKTLNLGMSNVETGMVLKRITGLVPLATVPGDKVLANYSLIGRPPMGSRGRLKLTLSKGGSACAITVIGSGPFPQSEVVNLLPAGEAYTVKTYSLLGALSSDVAPGDTLQIDMEVAATQRATAGDKDVVLASSDAAPGGAVLYQVGGESMARCDALLAPVHGAELVAGAGGMAVAKTGTGDVIGTIARAEIITKDGRAYVPIAL
jgi:hypothetical protein